MTGRTVYGSPITLAYKNFTLDELFNGRPLVASCPTAGSVGISRAGYSTGFAGVLFVDLFFLSPESLVLSLLSIVLGGALDIASICQHSPQKAEVGHSDYEEEEEVDDEHCGRSTGARIRSIVGLRMDQIVDFGSRGQPLGRVTSNWFCLLLMRTTMTHVT